MRHFNKTPKGALWGRWKNMLSRCYDPANKRYRNYGGRGIIVCDEWHDYHVFYQWGVVGWKQGLQIDRIDNSKGYSPENCRWVTSRQNNRNRSNNKLNVEKVADIRKALANGETGPSLARKYGVHHSLIYRIKLGQQWL